jgi:phage terminase Nu1 subunit (DNA packaging protein)
MRNRRNRFRGSSDSNRPTGFYLEYLERLIAKRAAERRERPHDPEAEERYWRERERLHAEATKQLPLKKAA